MSFGRTRDGSEPSTATAAGWERATEPLIKKPCLCCKRKIDDGKRAHQTIRNRERNFLCGPCFDVFAAAAGDPLFSLPTWKPFEKIKALA